MRLLIKLIVAVAIIVVVGYALIELRSGSDAPTADSSDQADGGVRVEEKYGFTTDSVGD